MTVAKKLEAEIKGKSNALDTKLNTVRKEFGLARSAITKTIKNLWPELANSFHPAARDLISDPKSALFDTIYAHEKYKYFMELAEEVIKMEEEKYDLDRQDAQVQRFIHAYENVILAHNLSLHAPPDICERYNALIALEAGVLGQR
jgi:hypothetical protein